MAVQRLCHLHKLAVELQNPLDFAHIERGFLIC